MDHSTILFLDDPTCQRLVLTWHLIPAHVRKGNSQLDIASHASRVAGCQLEEAMGRLVTLVQLGVVNLDGSVDAQAKSYLDSKALARLNGLSSFQPSAIAEAFITAMSLHELRGWLNEKVPALFDSHGLEWSSDDADEGVH
jgi:hypothetical protein